MKIVAQPYDRAIVARSLTTPGGMVEAAQRAPAGRQRNVLDDERSDSALRSRGRPARSQLRLRMHRRQPSHRSGQMRCGKPGGEQPSVCAGGCRVGQERKGGRRVVGGAHGWGRVISLLTKRPESLAYRVSRRCAAVGADHHRRPPTDFLISAIAHQHSAPVLHYDIDYEVSPPTAV